MVTVPARHINYPWVTYKNETSSSPLNNTGDRPQWTLDKKSFIECGIGGLSRNILVLVPTDVQGQPYTEHSNAEFATQCIEYLGAGHLRYGAKPEENYLTKRDFNLSLSTSSWPKIPTTKLTLALLSAQHCTQMELIQHRL